MKDINRKSENRKAAVAVTGYSLTRRWFDFCVNNREKIAPVHTALFTYIIDLANRHTWKPTFGLPTDVAKDTIGIANSRTYAKAFQDLVTWGFIKVYQESVNQYTCVIIGFAENALPTASPDLSPRAIALSQQTSEHSVPTASIIKQKNIKPKNLETKEDRKLKFAYSLEEYKSIYGLEMIEKFYDYWSESDDSDPQFRRELQNTWDLSRRLKVWKENDKKFKKNDGKEKPSSVGKTAERARR